MDVYIVRERDDRCLFSEFSAAEREQRERFAELAFASAGNKPKSGVVCLSISKEKLEWGCICRETEGILEGVILAQSVVEQNGWSEPELQMTKDCWESLRVGIPVEVVIVRKEYAHWRYVMYFGYKES